MKTVGKQLQEARLARNWTPELAARETKIKVDRLRDLEGDDYSHFTSPTYARGFVRTYARALGLDEYRILRQLDNKLPDADSANIVTETGVAYLPETAMPPRAAHRDHTGLYVVVALGAAVSLVIAFVLFEAYRVGELSRYFGSAQETVAAGTAGGTNAAAVPANPLADAAPQRALPIDSDTPPPIVEGTSAPGTTGGNEETNAVAQAAPVAVGPMIPPRALPVDPASLAPGAGTAAPGVPTQAPRALPVDPADLAQASPAGGTLSPVVPAPAPDSAAPDSAKAPLRALPVTPADLAADSAGAGATTTVAMNTLPPTPPDAADATKTANGTEGAEKTTDSGGARKSDPVEASSTSAGGTPPSEDPAGNGTGASPGSPVVMPAQPETTSGSDMTVTNAATTPAVPTEPTLPAGRGPVMEPSLPAVEPSTEPVPANNETATNETAQAGADSGKRLVLTASHDSFVRVTNLDAPEAGPLYAAVLHSGQSVGFDGHKFSINVGVPSAVDIKLDGVNYGPHSDQEEPETFTVQSHLP
jgi:cytoskeleton protein RodZ